MPFLRRKLNDMANVQTENGFTKIANEILEQMVKLRIPPSEKDILLCVIRKTYGWGKKQDRISLTQFEKETELSRMTVVKSLKNLLTRKLLVKSGILYGFNKDWETWVVKSGILVKSENIFSKVGYTKSGIVGYTHKRKKEMTKEITEQSSELVNLLIKTFEKVNPACKNFYARNPQRNACKFLIETYGFDKVQNVVALVLPKTNGLQFFPTITTPIQLQEKWATLDSAIKRYKAERSSKRSGVADIKKQNDIQTIVR